MIHVAIVHSSARYRRALTNALQASPSARPVFSGSTTAELARASRSLTFDVLIVDGALFQSVSRLVRALPGCAVIVSATRGDDRQVVSALRAGAAGHVLDGDEPAIVLDAIEQAAAGVRWIRESVSRKLATDLLDMVRSHIW